MWILLLLSLVQPAPVAGPNHKFEWDQYAYNLDVVETFKFSYYLDDSLTGTPLPGVKCIGISPNFVCSAPVPVMGNGTHTIKLDATNVIGTSGQSLEFRFRYSRNAAE
jgi:hypothetical protein